MCLATNSTANSRVKEVMFDRADVVPIGRHLRLLPSFLQQAMGQSNPLVDTPH